MPSLTAKTLRGGVLATHGQTVVKEGEELTISPTGSEILAIGPIDVHDVKRATLFYNNLSSSKTATVKIKASPYRVIPSSITDSRLKQLGADISVSANSMSEPLMYEGGYHWILMTVTADAETNKGEAFVKTQNY